MPMYHAVMRALLELYTYRPNNASAGVGVNQAWASAKLEEVTHSPARTRVVCNRIADRAHERERNGTKDGVLQH